MIRTRWSFRSLGFVALALLIAACAPTVSSGGGVEPVLADRGAFVQEYLIDAGTEATFDAALRAGQNRNLDVESANRDVGLIEFEAAILSPQQLDQYSFYPYVDPNTGYEWSTFEYWDSIATGGVTGEITITLTITQATTKGTNVSIRTNTLAYSDIESFVVNSRGVLEDAFIETIRSNVAN